MNQIRVGDWFAVFFTVAIIYVLVRPQSKAAQLVQTLGQFLTALVRTATDTAK
jgi:hypothetical protein